MYGGVLVWHERVSAALMGEETYREWSRNEVFRRPTAGELAECPLAASFDAAHTTVEGAARELAGVS